MDSIRLYRYLPASSAINTIESHAFRVSRIRELNDPFEWLPGLDPVVPQAEGLARWCMDRFLTEIDDAFGIISLSEEIHDSVLWSHYADSHRGLAFEVEHLLDDHLYKVIYTNERPVIDPRWINDSSKEQQLTETLKGFWYRKSPGWAYEKERRGIIDLAKCKTTRGMFLRQIPDSFLKRLIVGIRCTIGITYLRRALDLNGFQSVEIIRAQQDNRTFNIRC